LHLSVNAQAKMLKKSRETIAEILENLATTVQTLDQYLGITAVSTSQAVPFVQAASFVGRLASLRALSAS
jgi:hypothetical protein